MTHHSRLSGVLAAAIVGLAAALTSPTFGQQLLVPIIERASDGLDTCALGEVTGLKADGDGFLAVRSAPGSSHPKIDEVHNGDRLWVFTEIGDWLGVVYDTGNVECSPVDKDREVQTDGKRGWVHKNWVTIIAG